MVDHKGQHSSPSVSREAAETLYSSSNEAILFHPWGGSIYMQRSSIFGTYLMCQGIVESDCRFYGSVIDLSPPFKDSLTWHNGGASQPLSSFMCAV